jgi:nucleotide-binding universal stress UspA family protein
METEPMPNRSAYMPLATYPDTVAEDSVHAAIDFASTLNCALFVTAFAVNIPRVSSPIGDMLIDVPGLVKATEEKSRAECRRRLDMVKQTASGRLNVECDTREIVLGAADTTAAYEARYHDFALLPWTKDTIAAQDMAQTLVFGSGRPTILVPAMAKVAPLKHIAIAWDGSSVAARALWDAVPFLHKGGRVSVLTVHDEKALSSPDLAKKLAAQLEKRGVKAQAINVNLESRDIANALQHAAVEAGAQMLAMGGFGHSRLRDFFLGGATAGVLSELQMPVLLSH